MSKKPNKKRYIFGSIALMAVSFATMPIIINKLTNVIAKVKNEQTQTNYSDEPEIVKIEREDN